jgi:hypothetical protein
MYHICTCEIIIFIIVVKKTVELYTLTTWWSIFFSFQCTKGKQNDFMEVPGDCIWHLLKEYVIKSWVAVNP